LLVCVGDVVSSYCSRLTLDFDGSIILIVDGKTRRHTSIKMGDTHGFHEILLTNKPGTVEAEAYRMLCDLIRRASKHRLRVKIVVSGEEDMLALPSIACAPEGGIVVYGVPGRGATIIIVNRSISRDAQSRFLMLRPSLCG